MSRKSVPSYGLHKASGQARVLINGKHVYLGKYGSDESRAAYARILAEHLTPGFVPPERRDPVTGLPALSINEVLVRYLEFAKVYYHCDHAERTELGHIKTAMSALRTLYGESLASDFGPRCLKALQQHLIELGTMSRSTINSHVNRVRRIFRWAVAEELLHESVYAALMTVSPLKRGRCEAHDNPPVLPVPEPQIAALEDFVSKPVWALIQLQLHTAARPGELVALRPCDIDTSDTIWKSIPQDHKTAHHGHQRTIFFGPKAKEILSPLLTRPTDAYLFCPAEADAERRDTLSEQRKTPLSCGNRRGTNRKRSPRRSPGDVYTVASYRRAIAYACDRAFPPPAPLARREGETVKQWRQRLTDEGLMDELKAWQRQHRWHPHQLRHNAATRLRKEFGIEVARVILGHRSAVVTELYAERDLAKAAEVMEKVG